MRKLLLELSNGIVGDYQTEFSDFTDGIFVINRSFTIDSVDADGVRYGYLTKEVKDNYKIIQLDSGADDSALIRIQYHGILDGTTGGYPYAKERTSDEFYILRSETVFYPITAAPDSREYEELLMNMDAHSVFQVTINLKDTRQVCTNLKIVSQNTYTGWNPTVAVGRYSTLNSWYGTIFYHDIDSKRLGEVEGVITAVNEYMMRYKKARINDYQIICIPNGYGSFVLPGTMFVAEEGLDGGQLLIHELIHTNWNPCCTASGVLQARFFDEAITQYFMCRVCIELGIKSRETFVKEFEDEYCAYVSEGYEIVPIEKYAQLEYGDLSYSFGPLFLLAIEELIGIAEMDKVLSRMLEDFAETEIDLQSFQGLFPKETKGLFDSYVYGTEAAENIIKKVGDRG